ncbi:MAG: cytochrome c4 [Rhodocyclales bacterium]|nr:cytochrome c4 [Rhodocyclales bacterium]
MRFFRHLPLALLLGCTSPAVFAVDLEKGKEINGTCAACHGEFGQGGKKGEYPRIAGQRVRYLESQLRAFRARTRVNIPMFPYTQERELSDEDIRDVAAYLASVELPTKMPSFAGNEDALTRLQMVDKVMIIPRAEGDTEAGGALYRKQCAGCHATNGRGKGMFPMLGGQYTSYLRRQIELYLKGDRPHDEEGTQGRLNALSESEIRDILAHLTTLQGEQE